MTIAVGCVLLVGIVLYGVFGGADFGAGLWDLTAGGAHRGKRARDLIDHAIGPVWEANHTWLIFCLVILWSGFPTAFAAIVTTLYIPLGISVLGIVLRGSGFAFRKVLTGSLGRQINSVAFAMPSVITPFGFGTVAGGIASGRVPSDGYGDPVTSWLNPTSLLGGVLAVMTCSYLAALFLTEEGRHAGAPDLVAWAHRRAILAAGAAGIVALAGLFVLHEDARRLFDRLTAPALPLVLVSAVAGLAALAATMSLADRWRWRPVRGLGALAVAAILAGWGVGQYPYLLGDHLTISDAAAPPQTMDSLIVVAGLAAVFVVPPLAWLLLLTQRGELSDPDATSPRR
ncbi:cytochrome d ubiquinol oxidase subunit II [Nocardioides sp. KR10-350]|uniref:cytochrome d ubiquinol oxidase subunit II n=1 Tax=Nocardioides cheoyonin TaxID=3156615 RepID=UPI0032B44470